LVQAGEAAFQALVGDTTMSNKANGATKQKTKRTSKRKSNARSSASRKRPATLITLPSFAVKLEHVSSNNNNNDNNNDNNNYDEPVPDGVEYAASARHTPIASPPIERSPTPPQPPHVATTSPTTTTASSPTTSTTTAATTPTSLLATASTSLTAAQLRQSLLPHTAALKRARSIVTLENAVVSVCYDHDETALAVRRRSRAPRRRDAALRRPGSSTSFGGPFTCPLVCYKYTYVVFGSVGDD
jgi:hypothetical protein